MTDRLAVILRRMVLVFLIPAFLSACSTAEPLWAPDEQVQAARFVAGGPPTLTLFTVINNRSNAGAHSGLMINGSQRIIFDPAGTFKSPQLPERNDVVYGISNRALELYIDYHSRETFHMIIQEIPVSAAVAEQAMQLVQSYGAVPKAQCAKSVSAILRQLPGFEFVDSTWYPKQISQQFEGRAGVSTRRVYDNDSDDNKDVLLKAQQL